MRRSAITGAQFENFLAFLQLCGSYIIQRGAKLGMKASAESERREFLTQL